MIGKKVAKTAEAGEVEQRLKKGGFEYYQTSTPISTICLVNLSVKCGSVHMTT